MYCLTVPHTITLSVCLFLQVSDMGRLYGRTVTSWCYGGLGRWLIELYCYLHVWKTAHHLLWWHAYTLTQTCTYTVHRVYLYTYCTHAHECMCLDNTWVRPTTVTIRWGLQVKWTLAGPKTVWFIISKVHWESWWDCENVALCPFFYFSRYVLLLLF